LLRLVHGDVFYKYFYSSPGRIPNFLIAGVQKSGTTSVATHLRIRTNVCGPMKIEGVPYSSKEAHFFDKEERVALGASGYANLFAHCRKNVPIIMDATPAYERFPEIVRSVYDEFGGTAADDLKILFTLREPVSRDISRYNHFLRIAANSRYISKAILKQDSVTNETTTKTFEEYAVDFILPSFEFSNVNNHSRNENRGLYAYWLQKWLSVFDRKQILVLSYDDMLRDPHDYLERVHAFLELPPPSKLLSSLPHKNSEKVDHPPFPCAIQEQLAAAYEIPNQELYALLEAEPGPAMERRPFPKFKFKCKEG